MSFEIKDQCSNPSSNDKFLGTIRCDNLSKPLVSIFKLGVITNYCLLKAVNNVFHTCV
jgi:hypothetical protein